MHLLPILNLAMPPVTDAVEFVNGSSGETIGRTFTMHGSYDYYDEKWPESGIELWEYMRNRVMAYDGTYSYILRAPVEGRLWTFESERPADPPSRRTHHYRENWEYDPFTRDRVRSAVPIAYAQFGIRANPNIGREPFHGWGDPGERLQ